MRRLSISLFAAFAALSAPGAAQAGLLPPLPSLDQPGNLDDSDSGANWYLRGAFGASLPSNPSMQSRFLPGTTLRDPTLQSGWTLSGAIGYQLGWLRGDLSVDYLGQRSFIGNSAGSCGSTCSATLKGSVSAVPILANVYYDIGTWNRLTPYLSAGLGAAHVNWEKLDATGACSGPCPAVSGTGSWRFAWQVGAGLNLAVTDKVSIDADYRLLDLGKGRAGTSPVGNLASKTLWDNEIRLGLRYKLN